MSVDMIFKFQTDNLIIKTPNSDDLDNLYKLQSDPQVMKYVGSGVRQKEVVADKLQKYIKHYEKHDFSFGSIYLKDTNEFIGWGGLIYLDFNDSQPDIEIGYAFLPEFWNKGYATEVVKDLVYCGFKRLSIDKIVAATLPDNIPSQKVLEKAKFTYVDNRINDGWGKEVSFYEIKNAR